MSTDETNPELPQDATASEEVVEQVASGPVEEVDEFGFTADELIEDDDEEEDEDEDVSPIDEFVDEASVPVEGEEIEMNWYILKVQVNRERTICEQLNNLSDEFPLAGSTVILETLLSRLKTFGSSTKPASSEWSSVSFIQVTLL